jgi:hypothetical protein
MQTSLPLRILKKNPDGERDLHRGPLWILMHTTRIIGTQTHIMTL